MKYSPEFYLKWLLRKAKALRTLFFALFMLIFYCSGNLYAQTATYSTAGNNTWYCPVGVTSVTVSCWGAGGGGGSITSSVKYATAGGGAGGSFVKYTLTVTPGTTYNLTVGSGGPAATVGGNSYFGNSAPGSSTGATVLAVGGAGGTSNGVAGISTAYSIVAPGTASNAGNVPSSGATCNTAGTSGAVCVSSSGTSGAGGNGAGDCGAALGGGGGAAIIATASNGNTGTNPGGGGSGAETKGTATTKTGGTGGVGQIILSFTCPALSGTYTIGSGGNFTTITQALASLNCGGVSSAVTFKLLDASYSGSETFPLTINSIAGASATNTITFEPSTGVTSTISGSNATAIFDLNGANYVVFDGRQNGSGTPNSLIVCNTSTAGAAIRLINDACHNTVQYCEVKGVNTSVAGGVILFSTSTGTTGNDYNTVDNCAIHDNGSNALVNCIYALGTSGKVNDNNTISNCNIYDFYSGAANHSGIFIEGFNSDWTISSNNFYQTVANRTSVAYQCNVIYINNTSGVNFTISGNHIGGANASTTGTWSISTASSAGYVFVGIRLNGGTSTKSTISSNIIKNMTWNSSSAGIVPWQAIFIQAGMADVTSNVIGATTGNSNVVSRSTATTNETDAIVSSSTSTVNITNNNIGSIDATTSAATACHVLYGIRLAGASGTFTISGNTIGSTDPSTTNSLNATSTSTSYDQWVVGIQSDLGGTVTISGNWIANINNAVTIGNITYNVISGIVTTAGTNTISGNVIYNLSTPNTSILLDAKASVIGICQTSTVAAVQTISGNTIYSLSNTGAAAVEVIGIYNAGSTSATHLITGNFVHSLTATSTTAIIEGININAGKHNVLNNMIRLGVNASGNAITTQIQFRGIKISSGATSTNKIYYNSVYIGGTGVTNAANHTACIYRNETTSTTTVENNILFNARSYTSVAATGYNVAFQVITSGTTGLTSTYNDLYVTGTNGVIGRINTTNYAALSDWYGATNTPDVTGSISSDPSFNTPTGTSATVSLHVSQCSSIIGNGLDASAIITTDYDGATRLTGVKPLGPCIGADETSLPSGNFYSASSGNLEVTTNWWSNPDGATGLNPCNFTNPSCVYIICHNSTPTIGAAWTVSGTGSKVVVGNGTDACNFTIPSSYALTTTTIDVSANATLTIQNTTIPTLGTLNATATVDYDANNNQTLSSATYGNLTLSRNSGTTPYTKTAGGPLTVAGNLTINDAYTVFDGSSYTHTITGNFTNSGGTFTPSTCTVTLNNSSAPQTISGITSVTNLTSNSYGMTLSNSVTVSGTLTMNGNITTGANIITIGTGIGTVGTLTRNSGTIIGTIKRWFAASTVSNVLFPIGYCNKLSSG